MTFRMALGCTITAVEQLSFETSLLHDANPGSGKLSSWLMNSLLRHA